MWKWKFGSTKAVKPLGWDHSGLFASISCKLERTTNLHARLLKVCFVNVQCDDSIGDIHTLVVQWITWMEILPSGRFHRLSRDDNENSIRIPPKMRLDRSQRSGREDVMTPTLKHSLGSSHQDCFHAIAHLMRMSSHRNCGGVCLQGCCFEGEWFPHWSGCPFLLEWSKKACFGLHRTG
jgi:hypothetical protein